MQKVRISTGILGFAACAGIALGAAPASAAAVAHHPAGTVITVGQSAFGPTVVVGSGPFKGFSLYMITSDVGTHFGCLSYPVKTPIGPFLCTGPPNDKKAEWPAITTKGAPVAGPGIRAGLLGTVKRSFGTQVTYAGHPLYLFDTGPGQVTGMGWDEPTLPPWHGLWSLISPSGRALWWDGQLTVTRVGHGRVLAARMMTGIGWVSFPVYTGKPTSADAASWPEMLTDGVPGAARGVHAAGIGTVRTAQGRQVTYRGAPLYYYANEKFSDPSTGKTAGNGNGVDGFSLVRP